MGKILFLCTDHFDLYKIFQNGIEQYTNYEVDTILYPKFKYKNKKQKIQNFFSKLFFRENLKHFFSSKAIIESIPKDVQYDYMLVICPDLLHQKHMPLLKSIAKKTIVYYWDGFNHFPRYKESLSYFDDLFSFDPVDVEKYNLKFITNFYFVQDRNTETKTDLFFLSSYDSRYPVIKKIVSLLEKQNKKVLIYQHTKDLNIIEKKQKNNLIKFIDTHIPFEKTTELMKETKIVLDIHKDIQHGLSFRVFEAMGLGKKLITTNADIINYDFYNPNNIFVWKKDTDKIPEYFLNTPYQELPENIYRKYSQENWIKTIFNL
jgi:hypothetical protein